MFRALMVVAIVSMAFISPVRAAEPIVIGAYLPMSGDSAAYGQMGWIGISVAKEMQPSVLGRPILLRLVDTKSEKMEAANAVARLIDKEKAVAIIGEMTSGSTIAGSKHAERRGIPMVSPTATNPIITRNKRFIFRVCFIDTDQGHIAAKLARERLKAETAALFVDISQDYCVGLAGFFKKEFKKAGGKIVCEARFKIGDRDFTPQLRIIKRAKPDVIYAPVGYTECALMAKQAREQGMNMPILSSDSVEVPELIKLGGKAVEDIYLTSHFHKAMIKTDRGKKFQAIFERETGRELNSPDAMAADAYFVVVDAIKRAGAADPKKIRDALASTKDFQGVSGKITLKPDGDAIRSMVINKVKNGQFVYVTTINP